MTPVERALLRLTLDERQLAEFDQYRNESDPDHERLLRKLRLDLERAEADLRWAEQLPSRAEADDLIKAAKGLGKRSLCYCRRTFANRREGSDGYLVTLREARRS